MRVSLGDANNGPYSASAVPAEAYNPNGFGGVTRVVLDPETLEVISSNLVLAGTIRNCAGGMSPWGWLSCEETVSWSRLRLPLPHRRRDGAALRRQARLRSLQP